MKRYSLNLLALCLALSSLPDYTAQDHVPGARPLYYTSDSRAKGGAWPCRERQRGSATPTTGGRAVLYSPRQRPLVSSRPGTGRAISRGHQADRDCLGPRRRGRLAPPRDPQHFRPAVLRPAVLRPAVLRPQSCARSLAARSTAASHRPDVGDDPKTVVVVRVVRVVVVARRAPTVVSLPACPRSGPRGP